MSVVACIVKHLGQNSPIRAYKADMSDDVAELVAGGMEKEAAWLQVIDEKLTNLRGEKARIEQVVADAYANTAAGKRAAKPASGPKDSHPKTVMGSDLLAAMSKRLGGLDPAWLSEFSTRFETAKNGKDGKPLIQWRNPMIPGVGKLFRRGGTQDLQQIAEVAESMGYLDPGTVERDSKEAGELAKGLIRAALNRQTLQTTDERIAEEEAGRKADEEAYYAELDAESAREAEAEREAIMAEADFTLSDMAEMEDGIPWDDVASDQSTEEAMRAMGFSEQEIEDELAKEALAREESGRAEAAATAAGKTAAADEARGAAQGSDEDVDPEEAAFKKGDFKEMIRLRDERLRAELEAIGDVDNGAILKHTKDARWVMVLPDVEGGGKWRIQRFDKNGFSGHMVFNSQKAATEAAMGEGFKTRDDGAMDRMQDTPEFQRGNFAADLIRQLNGKDITREEADRQLAEYDAQQEARQEGLTLEAQTPADLKAKAEREQAATDGERRKKAAEQERLRREAEQRDIRARADQTVDDFQLGQDADAQMSGMGDMFADSPDAGPAAITPNEAANMRRGDIVRDSKGVEYYAWSARFGRLDVMPMSDGKPVVNNSSAIRFALDDTTKSANPEYRTDPLFLVRSAESAPTKIDDIGEKIGGARKDTAVSTGPTRKRATDDARPAWARRFEISQIVTPAGMIGEVKNAGRWVIRDSRSLDWTKQPKQVGRDTFATKEEAEAFVPIAAVSLKHRAVPSRDGKYEIWRDITDRKRVKVVDQQFDTREDAMAYMVKNAAQIVETNTTFGEADLPLPPNRQRTGPERRDGNVVGEDFKDTFGFRGVEFGEWNNQDERQSLMNDAWDGLMDLADVLGLPPRALGLNGDLALAFGARGQGLNSARAHYESERAVINLTKEKGAGSLAHEWFHALDHYFGRQDGKTPATWDVQPDGTRTLKARGGDADMASGGFLRNKSGVRPEVRAAYERLLNTMVKKAEVYVEDMAKVDKFTGQTREELARELDMLRKDFSEQKDVRYWKRNNKPASAEVLAEFDSIAKSMLDGDMLALTSDWRIIPGNDKAKAVARWTNDALERLSVLYKQVRGRTGFTAEKSGMLDRLRGDMTRYSQRLKMLADAQSSTEKTRMVPTEFAMNARELDQGRGTDYWTTPHELAARAFQGYVEDKVAERGGTSRFLNYAPEGAAILTPWGFKRPYPAGQERKTINAEFDNLLGVIQTKTDEAGNVAMFKRSAPKRPRVTTEVTEEGFPTFNSDAIRIDFPSETERFEVIPGEGEKVVNYAIMPPDSFDVWGHVELLVKDGVPTSLLDIEINKSGRGEGVGRKVMEALLAANPDADLNISNIVTEARGFWEKMGVPAQNLEEGAAYDGTLNWQTYSDAYSGAESGVFTRGRQAGFRRDAGAEGRRGSQDRQAQEAVQRLTKVAEGISAAWANAPDVVVAYDMQDTAIPQVVRDEDARQKSQGASGEPEGFYYEGKVYLLASQLGTDADAARVLFHEALGHAGLQAAFGQKLTPLLDQMARLYGPVVRAKAKEYGLDMNDAADRRIAAEEVLAELAQTRPDSTWVQKALATIKAWLRENVPGFADLKMTDSEVIARFIVPARGAIEGRNGEQNAGVKFSRAEGGSGETAIGQGAMFSRSSTPTAEAFASLQNAKLPAGYILNDFFKSTGKVSWWSKTVGTMHDLAQKNPAFRKVYDSAQNFLNDVSFYATEASNEAPSLLPKLETIRDVFKSPLSAEDTKAISAPIFQGTLSWTRDEDGKPVKEDDPQKAGIVWTDAELKSKFGLSDKQANLYHEFRNATDKSLTHLAISDMVRYAGKDAQAVAQRAMDSGDVTAAAAILADHLEQVAAEDTGRSAVLSDTAAAIGDKADRARDLMARGYAPLSRYGNYTLDAVDDKGQRLYFGLFESQAEANRMARTLQDEFPGATIAQGTLSNKAYQMFAGVSPETLELFGDMLGLEAQGDSASAQVFQEYLKLAKSNRSAMKRLIERKGVAGFSEDAGRVLAGFVYSNSRQTSKNLHFGQITQATNDIANDKGQGELLDAAVSLHQYITNPQEEAQKIKGLMFTQFLGGSIASAMVNLTQPIAVTFPYLSQFGGAAKAAKQMTAALADAAKWETTSNPRLRTTGDKALDAAMKKAEEDGIVSPQETHNLIAQAGGKGALKAGDGTLAGNLAATGSNFMSKVMLGWGRPFAVAEQFNRRATYIAAYRTAVEQGMADPSGFAEKAIAETQFTYNKGNRPQWARGAVGSTLFTFKQYSISYVELMTRMARSGPEGRKAAALGLAVLFLMAGLQGLPGADDLDDIIDGALQRMGYNWNSKQQKRELLASLVGDGGAMFLMRGLSGLPGAPIDVSGRLGIGNLIPGTGLLTKKEDYSRDALEILGPAGSFAQQIGKGAGKLAEGEPIAAIKSILPVAAANMVKSADMASTGMYRDDRGRKVIDTDGIDAAFKAIGFQPNDVARVQRATGEVQSMIAQTKIREGEIADKWARGMFEKDADLVKEARDELARWNESNPATRIAISSAKIVKRLQSMRQDKTQRLAKTAPKEIRATVRRELEGVQ